MRLHLESDNSLATPFAGPTFYQRYLNLVAPGTAVADGREPLPTAPSAIKAKAPCGVRAFKASTDNRTVLDLGSVRNSTTGVVNWGNISVPGPYKNPYASVPHSLHLQLGDLFRRGSVVRVVRPRRSARCRTCCPSRPKRSRSTSSSWSVKNLTGDAFGRPLFAWPESNFASAGVDSDLYQTWMGVKYSGFGDYTAAVSGAVMANYNCNINETCRPVLVQPAGRVLTSKRFINHSEAAFVCPSLFAIRSSAAAAAELRIAILTTGFEQRNGRASEMNSPRVTTVTAHIPGES